jgi:hypothetical protein
MNILTLNPLYATLITLGAKKIETRNWQTSYRGPIAIHAAAGLGPVGGERGLRNIIASAPFFEALYPLTKGRLNGKKTSEQIADLLPRGAIVAVAMLADCCTTPAAEVAAQFGRGWVKGGIVSRVSAQERAFGDYGPGRYAWLLSDVRPLRTPLPYRGSQGLRPLPAEVVAQIEAQL